MAGTEDDVEDEVGALAETVQAADAEGAADAFGSSC